MDIKDKRIAELEEELDALKAPQEPVATGHDGLSWPDTLDAKIWADEFCKRYSASDHGTMIAWFANAIMRGYDSRHVQSHAQDGEVVAAVDSQSDAAIIKWISDYRPKVGDMIYARHVPAKVPEGWKIDDVHSAMDAVRKHGSNKTNVEILAMLAAAPEYHHE